MSLSEKLEFLITANGTQAANEFKKVGLSAEEAMASAEGASGKAGGALGTLKENAGTLALAGGAAFVAFAAKGVEEFQKTALAAAKFSDATRVSTQDASRLLEVANDLGISGESVQSAMLKMEKAVGSNSPAFKELGVEIVRTGSGALDANATFLATVDRLRNIKDAGERSAQATKIFGKSWADLSELINKGDLRQALADVSAQKVIDPAEVETARAFRDGLAKLKDAGEELSIEVGQQLVPALTGVAKSASEAISKFTELDAWYNKASKGSSLLGDAFTYLAKGPGELLTQDLQNQSKAHDTNTAAMGAASARLQEMADKYAAFDESTSAAAQALYAMNQPAQTLQATTKQLAADTKILDDNTRSYLGILRAGVDAPIAYSEAQLATASAMEALNKVQSDRTATIPQVVAAEDSVKKAILDQGDKALAATEAAYGLSDAQVSASDKAKIQAGELQKLADGMAPGSSLRVWLDQYIAQLNAIPSSVNTTVHVSSSGTVQHGTGYVGATGGIVRSPTRALIGEAGPEAVIPLNTAPGASPLDGLGGGGATINLTVNAGLGTNGTAVGQQIVEELNRFVRTAGNATPFALK